MINSQTFASQSHQDWQTVVLRNKKQKQYSTSEQDINVARRNNMQIETRTKVVSQPQLRKVEMETEDFHVKKVPTSVGKDIERARVAKKLTQEALAKALNMQPKQINEIERGQALYDGQLLSKVKRYLGI